MNFNCGARKPREVNHSGGASGKMPPRIGIHFSEGGGWIPMILRTGELYMWLARASQTHPEVAPPRVVPYTLHWTLVTLVDLAPTMLIRSLHKLSTLLELSQLQKSRGCSLHVDPSVNGLCSQMPMCTYICTEQHAAYCNDALGNSTTSLAAGLK